MRLQGTAFLASRVATPMLAGTLKEATMLFDNWADASGGTFDYHFVRQAETGMDTIRPQTKVDTLTMVLDAAARIHYCSDPSALGYRSEDLVGRCLRDLLPKLPLRTQTPGYNVAYAKFWFGQGQQQVHDLVLSSGERIPCELRLLHLAVAKRNLLLADLRLIAQARRRTGPMPAPHLTA
jgi:hypothetical protein